MKRSSFSIQFFIRESRIKKDGTATIEVKITINGKKVFSLPKRTLPQIIETK